VDGAKDQLFATSPK